MLTRTRGLMDKIPQLMWPLGQVVLTLKCYKERFGLKADAVINQRKKEARSGRCSPTNAGFLRMILKSIF